MKAITKNTLFYGDNLQMMQKYIADESIDLCYIDPPFNSKRSYNQIYNNLGQEDKAQAQAFTDTWTWDTQAIEGFESIIKNQHGLYTTQSIKLIIGLSEVLDKGSLLAYLVSMTQRIAEIWRVLKPTGSFYLHCDPTASHYLKLILDALFCTRGGDMRNEIVWCYTRPSASRRQFPRTHDVIFFFAKSDETPFYLDQVRVPYNAETLARSNRNPGEKSMMGSKGKNRLNPLGKLPQSWWEIPIIQGNAVERLGYPTQKPEALLERIINASTNEGNTVLDCYCGCGTSIAVAQRLNRQWVGIDITYQAISVILKRLTESFGDGLIKQIDLMGQPKDIEGARALATKKDDRLRKEFEKWAILTYSNNLAVINEKKGADKGIDGTAFMQMTATDYKPIIFSVKSGRNLGVDMVRDLGHVVTRENAARGILITLEEPTAPMLKEAREAGMIENELMRQKFSRLEIVTTQQILEGQRLIAPMTHTLLKKAKEQSSSSQPTLEM